MHHVIGFVCWASSSLWPESLAITSIALWSTQFDSIRFDFFRFRLQYRTLRVPECFRAPRSTVADKLKLRLCSGALKRQIAAAYTLTSCGMQNMPSSLDDR